MEVFDRFFNKLEEKHKKEESEGEMGWVLNVGLLSPFT